jgi:hypothetical protein
VIELDHQIENVLFVGWLVGQSCLILESPAHQRSSGAATADFAR